MDEWKCINFIPSTVQKIAIQGVLGLNLIHRLNYIHGNLKPSNILINDDEDNR